MQTVQHHDVLERGAVEQLHRIVEDAVVGPTGIEDRDCIRTGEPSGELNLPLEAGSFPLRLRAFPNTREFRSENPPRKASILVRSWSLPTNTSLNTLLSAANKEITMKRILGFLGAAMLLGAIVIPGTAEARRPTVVCTFTWNDNPSQNVRHGVRYKTRKVRTREYNRLVGMGTVPVRVAADRGQHCQLNHPENSLIDVPIRKSMYKLTPEGRLPNCGDFGAVVTCRGK